MRCTEWLVERRDRVGNVAAALSIIPGLGHIYRGYYFHGLCWFTFTPLAYALLVLPGLFMHWLCIREAGRI